MNVRNLFRLAALSLCIAVTNTTKAQDNPHELAVVVGAGMHSNIYSVLSGDNPLKFGFKAGFNYTFFIADQWGIGTGAEFYQFNNRVGLPDNLWYTAPVAGGSPLHYITNFSGFSEKQVLSVINIPLTLQFNAAAGKSVRFYSLAGVKFGLPVRATYAQTAVKMSGGIFDENSWYYDERFSINDYAHNDKLKLKMPVSLTAEAGTKILCRQNLWIYVGAYIDYALNDVRNATDVNLVQSNAASQSTTTTSHSILQMSTATTAANPLAFGLNVRVGLRVGKKKEAKVQDTPVREVPVKEVVVQDTVVQEVVVQDTVVQEVVREIPQEIKQTMTKLSNTLFAFDRFNLSEESITELNKVVRWLKENPQISVEVEGHTDNIGSIDYNQNLSENRARSVYNYFVENGVDASRLSYRGYGQTRPIATNDTESGRQENRRVELKIMND